jgi:hypothetical protein
LAQSYLVKAIIRLKIPTEAYGRDDAAQALRDAQWVASIARQVIPLP